MANEPIQGLPYPLPSDTNDPPRDIKALADATVSRTNMRFATAGARDAAITAPVAGMECYVGTGSSATKQIYHNGGWREKWGTRTASAAPEAGFTGTITYTREGQWIEVVVSLTGTVAAGATPTISAAVAADFRPSGNRNGIANLGGGFSGLLVIGTNGQIVVTNQTGAARSAVNGSIVYRAG